jgi:potassium-transporting ATPase KdpC subunit
MKRNFAISVLFTLVTTVMFGIIYPLGMTGISQLLFRDKAGGQLVSKDGKVVGSQIIGQAFTGPGYFHSRPSAAGMGNGYDPMSSGGSNLASTSKALVDRVNGAAQSVHAENPLMPVPVDLVTTSGSGLDPDITPAAAEFQIPRVAKERGMNEAAARALVARHSEGRQFGVLGEASVNVLELNLDLDAAHPTVRP